MNTTEVKELRVDAKDNSKRVMYLIKEFLLNTEMLDVVSGTSGAPVASRAVEFLVRLKYVTYQNIKTETSISEGRRRTRFIIRVQKTPDFKKLFDENEANRKRVIEEREKRGEGNNQTTNK